MYLNRYSKLIQNLLLISLNSIFRCPEFNQLIFSTIKHSIEILGKVFVDLP